MPRAVPEAAIRLAREFEKCRLVCFDTDGSGTPTIGWGRTRGLTHADVGRKTITQELADAYLEADFEEAAQTMENQIGRAAIAAMTDNQYGAIVDMYYNIGSLGPTIVRLLKARQFDTVPSQMAKYVYSGKVKLNGLVRRRNADILLWSTDEPGSSDGHVASGELRLTETPPAPSAEATKPLGRQGSFVATATTAVCTTGVAAMPLVQSVTSGLTTVSDRIAPYADSNAHVSQVRGWIIGVLAFLSVVSVALLWMKDRARKLESVAAPMNTARAVFVSAPDPVEPAAPAPVPVPAVHEPVQLELPIDGPLHIVVVAPGPAGGIGTGRA